METLQKNGHTTYLVGGCVRDLLVGLKPKDFDISTTARPRQVKRLIKNSFIIGRRFRLVLAKKGEEQYEISTFRRGQSPGENTEDLPDGDNIFGSPEEDANRRDYTCNALFYDPIKKEVIDHTSGVRDLEDGWIRMIGDPNIRLKEDSIRILRALRFSKKLNIQIEPELKEALCTYADELKFSALPRRREEYLKLMRLKDPSTAFTELYDLSILEKILPTLHDFLENKETLHHFNKNLREHSQDLRRAQDPSHLFGILLWSIYYTANHEIDIDDQMNWIKSDEVQTFAKHELGVFNTELTNIEQAFRLIPQLLDFPSLERKSLRRQVGLLAQKAFPLALLLYSQIETTYLDEWIELFEHLKPQFKDFDKKEALRD